MIEAHPDGFVGVRRIMSTVVIALLPGLLLMALTHGSHVLANVLLCVITATLCDAGARRVRGVRTRADGAALVISLIVVAVLPATAPWYVAAGASVCAILAGKEAYGGLGRNPFNPAMVGIAIAAFAYPPAFSPVVPAAVVHTAAAVLVSAAYCCGGLFLLYRRVITWHAPTAMLGTLGVLAALTYRTGLAGIAGTLLMNSLAGGMWLFGFFIVTDPVSGPTTRHGQLVFGAAAAVLMYVAQALDAVPAGAACAVLLANATVPLIDRLTLRAPRDRTATDDEPSQTQ